jgi:hypothetical protein
MLSMRYFDENKTPVIPAFRRLRQDDCQSHASLGYIKKPKKMKRKKYGIEE